MSDNWRLRGERAIEERFHEGEHFKQLGEHHPDCFMLLHSSGSDPEAFIVHDGAEYRDRIGRKVKGTNGSRWERYRCNDPKCEAVMLVRWDALARFISGGKG